MSASTDIPTKWTVPWANGDASKVEIPVSSSDSTRASLTLGFPPLTMQPPESGGVPPQGEDFNGGMNQIARIAWWVMQGGGFPYDSTFATSTGIAGYPSGALLPRADLAGFWLNQSDSNTTDPDATDGTAANWVPVAAYGIYALTSQTGGTVTVYPVNAARDVLTIAGTLTSNLTVQVPAWVKRWRVTNSTSGSYTVTVKTASGSGIVIPQNGAPTEIYGDGTNITQPPQNIAAATVSAAPLRVAEANGRLLNVQVFTASGTYTPTTGTTKIIVEVTGGGGSGGGAVSTAASVGGGGSGGAFARVLITPTYMPSTATVTVGTGASGNTGAGGGTGGTSSFGAFVSCIGGNGGAISSAGTYPVLAAPASTAVTITTSNVTVLARGYGGSGGLGYVSSSGGGATSGFGGASGGGLGGAAWVGTGSSGASGPANSGSGGSGACNNQSGGSNFSGGSGADGVVVVYEYGTAVTVA